MHTHNTRTHTHTTYRDLLAICRVNYTCTANWLLILFQDLLQTRSAWDRTKLFLSSVSHPTKLKMSKADQIANSNYSKEQINQFTLTGNIKYQLTLIHISHHPHCTTIKENNQTQLTTQSECHLYKINTIFKKFNIYCIYYTRLSSIPVFNVGKQSAKNQTEVKKQIYKT